MNLHSSRITRLLNEIDWDCEDQTHRLDSLNIIHGYPGSFISAIPGNIIDIFSTENDVVWDPFCGSGISAIESFKKGRRFIGNDINEIAIVTTLAKIRLIEFFELFEEHSNKLQDFIAVRNAEYIFEGQDNFKLDKASIPYDDITPWYSNKNIKDLSRLNQIILEFTTPNQILVIYRAIFLNIARLSNAQQKTWGHIADNVLPTEQQIRDRKIDVFKEFIKRVSLVRKRAQRLYIPSNNPEYIIENANAMDYEPIRKVDLVVTSPPYPQMNDYVTSHRLSYYWMNYSRKELDLIKKNELGARYRRKSTHKNKNYKTDLLKAFVNIVQHIKEKGIIAIVLPQYENNDLRKKTIDEFYNDFGNFVEHIYSVERSIDSCRWAPFKTLKKELLTIWCKNG